MKLIVGAWIIALAFGFAAVLNYGFTPGEAGEAVARLPAAGSDDARLRLTMVVHPHCPCSRAALESLAQVMARRPGRAVARVLFFKPDCFDDGWEQTDLWHSAARIPDTTPVRDNNGAEAARLGAATSGQVFLYSAGGDLLFRGGITMSRGHSGGNPAQDALMNCLLTGDRDPQTWPVFGCPVRMSKGTRP